MKKSLRRVLVCLFYAAFLSSTRGDLITGVVLCDSNTNRIADAGDTGLAGVKVVIVSEAGGFSDSTVTASDGSFSLTIPPFDPLAERRDPLSQVYIETLDLSTLPSDATVIFPQGVFGPPPSFFIDPAFTNSALTFNSAAGSSPTGDWLISSAACRAAPSPTPTPTPTPGTPTPTPTPTPGVTPSLVPSTNQCRLSGSGAIKSGNKTEHSFSGNVFSVAKKNGSHGQWTHNAPLLKLRFKSTVIDMVSCGSGTDGTTNLINDITFSGQGTLRSHQGKKTVSTPVLFTAAAEDLGNGKKGSVPDTYYIRVFDQAGNTLLLVNGDQTNPENIVPVPISKGNLRVRPGK